MPENKFVFMGLILLIVSAFSFEIQFDDNLELLATEYGLKPDIENE